MRKRRRCRKNSRRGVTVVEFALVASLLFMMTFAAIEFGRMLLVQHSLEAAAHDACRVAILDGANRDQVIEAAEKRLKVSGVSGHEIDVQPGSLNRAEQWDPVSVTIQVQFGDVTWLPVPQYLKDITLLGSCTLPREAEPADS